MGKHQIEPPATAACPQACPQCGAERISAEAVNTMQLMRPGTMLPGLNGPTTQLWALVCPQCGLTTLYAKDPAKLAGA